jgi:hypothetical protein
MKRGTFAVLGLLGFFLLAAPREAAACMRCGSGGFVCNGYDDCVIVAVCRAASFGQNSTVDCEVDSDGCHLTGEFCRWASNLDIAPSEKQPATTGSHEKDS